MKKLIFEGQEFKAERIIKNNDSIVGYNGDIITFKFSGISDFSGFTLADGQEFDVPQVTLDEQVELLGMQLALEKLSNMQSNQEKDVLIDSMGAQLAQMRIDMMQLKGGV